MKKIVSILLALSMAFSLSVISFASEKSVSLDEKCTVTISDEPVTYSFVPSETGVFKISVKLESSEETYITADVLLGEIILTSTYLSKELPEYETYSQLENKEYFPAKAGSEITIEFFTYYPAESQISFTISVADDIREITAGNSYDIDDEAEDKSGYFILRPTEDAVFNIWSFTEGFALLNCSDGSFESNKFYYQDLGLDFSFEVKAGEIYTVYIEGYLSGYEESDIMTINVADGSSIAPDFIEIDYSGAPLAEGETDWINIYVLPFGSNCNFESLIIEVADDEVVSCEYDEGYDQLALTGNKAGKTTVKVTVPGYNVSAEIEVEVLSTPSLFFRLLSEMLTFFIISINDSFINFINWF